MAEINIIYGAPVEASIHKWTDDETRQLIQLRTAHDNQFTGKRHTARKAWEVLLTKMVIDDTVSATQLAKKWDNLKRKYKELRFAPSGAGTDKEATPTTWAWFKTMHEAVGDGSSIEHPVVMDSSPCEVKKQSPDVDSGGRVSPPPPPRPVKEATSSSSQTRVEEEPGSSTVLLLLTQQEEDGEPASTSTSPPPRKRERRRRKEEEKSVLQFLEAEAAREEERFQATQESTKRFLELFEELVKKS